MDFPEPEDSGELVEPPEDSEGDKAEFPPPGSGDDKADVPSAEDSADQLEFPEPESADSASPKPDAEARVRARNSSIVAQNAFKDKSKQLRQQRRASMKVSLQLQALNMQRGGTSRLSARGRQQRQRRNVLNQETANKLVVKHTGKDLNGNDVNTTERRRVGAVSNAGSILLKDSVAGDDPNSGVSSLLNEYSEQMLPDIGSNLFRYVGGDVWFQIRKNKLFFNCKTRQTSKSPPKGIKLFSGSDEELPKAVLRLEVLRRDKERLRVATQVNKAIDMLMDKLDNDDFAAQVFERETALQSAHRNKVSEEEKKSIVTKGMFHYFDGDHSNEIDAVEFAQGIRLMAQDARRIARSSTDDAARSRAESSASNFDLLTDEQLTNMFEVIAGDDGIAQMDEFVAFYRSDGTVPDADNHSAEVVKTTKIVWTLLHDSEDLMLQHGTLDEIGAEQNLVQLTYQQMRDQATKT